MRLGRAVVTDPAQLHWLCRGARGALPRCPTLHALTLLLYCAHCGQPLRGSNSNDRYTYKPTKRCLAGNIRR